MKALAVLEGIISQFEATSNLPSPQQIDSVITKVENLTAVSQSKKSKLNCGQLCRETTGLNEILCGNKASQTRITLNNISEKCFIMPPLTQRCFKETRPNLQQRLSRETSIYFSFR